MHVIDLSHITETDMPVFPGDDPTVISRTHNVRQDASHRRRSS